MPVYRVQMPDGSVARIQADTSDDAMTHATSLIQKPGASQAKGNRSASDQTDYLRELQKQRAADAGNPAPTKGMLGKLESFGAGEVGPIAGELIGGLRAGGNAAANLFRSPDKKVSSRAIYEANRDATDEETARETNANPVSAGTGSVAGLLSAGGELAKGVGLLKGLAPVAKATAKASAAARAVPGVTQTAKAINAAKAMATANIAPDVLKYGGNVAKAVGTGAGVGGALGFSEGSDLDERIQNAADNLVTGGVTGGLLEGVGAPLAKPFVGAAKDIASGLLAKLRPAAAEGAMTEADRIAARNAVTKLAQSAGVTSSNLAARTAPYAGLDQTAAEALGSSGQSALGATARRSGTTGDNLRTQVRARTISQPQGIMSDFKDMLGVDPAAAQGDIEALVEAGKREAGPQFKAYYDATQGGVSDPEVERLLATPMGQRLMKSVKEGAKDMGKQSEGLTYGRVEVPPEGQGVNPMEAPPVGEFSEQPPPVPRGPAQAPSRGLSLTQWLARQGGIGGSSAGEAQAAGVGAIGSRSRMDPQELQALAEKAQAEGYFPEHDAPVSAATTDNYTRITGDDLTNALKEEIAGRPRYARQADPEAQARFDARARAEADQARYDQRPMDEPMNRDEYQSLEQPGLEAPAEGYGGHAPQYEPALQESLTGESLDRIRREANAMVTRDPLTGKPVLSGPKGVKNRRRVTWAQDFTNAVAGAPGAPSGALGADLLRKSLDTSSDYLGLGTAFKNFQGQLTRGSMSSFGKAWRALTPGAEQDAARGALAHDVIELWGRGQLKGGKFATPGITQKLELAFGKQGAKQFVQQMERRAELAASGARMAPFSGSPTMTLQEASAATNDMAPVAGSLARVGGKLAKGNIPGAIGEGVGALSTYAKTAGQSTAFRNELGRILSLPSNDPEFMALLKEAENLTPEQRADFLKVIAGGRLGGSQAGRMGTTGAVMADQTRHE